MVLAGIIIAATIGDSIPLNAKDNPTALYINEIAKQYLITFCTSLAKFR